MAPRRRMTNPDYAGAIRNGIISNLNGTRNSSSNFSTPMGGGFNLEQGREFEARRRQAESATPGQRDRFNPAVAQNVVDNFGFGVGASGNFEVNPAIAALNFLPFGKVLGPLGRVAKAVVPKATRVAAAAGRVSSNAQKINRARAAAANVARSDARDTFDRAAALRKPTLVGSDFYETSSKQVDALFDKWETTSYRVGQAGGPSAWQRAQDAARETGRTVVRTANDDIPGRAGETFRLRPTSAEFDLADQLDRGAGALVRKADDLARNQARFAGNPAAAAREIERRLRALKTGPVRRDPWRAPRNPAL